MCESRTGPPDRADYRPRKQIMLQQEREQMLFHWINDDNEKKRDAKSIKAPRLWRDELISRTGFIRTSTFLGKVPYCIAAHLRARGIGSDRLVSCFRIVLKEDGSVWEVLSRKKKEVILGTMLVPPITS